MDLSRRAWYREDPEKAQLDRDAPVIDELNDLVEKHPRWGFWKYFYALRLAGHPWNHKRVWRIYCVMKLNQKRRAKRRLPARVKTPLDSPSLPNHTWSLDFMSDTLYSGHRYRVLNIIDEGTREALDISIATSLPADDTDACRCRASGLPSASTASRQACVYSASQPAS